MTSPPDARSGLRIRRQVTLRPGSSRLQLVYVFENVLNRDDTLVDLGCGADVVQHSRWRSSMTTAGSISRPIRNRERPYEIMFGDDNPQYQLDAESGLLAVQYQGIVGKIGVHSPAGWIAFADRQRASRYACNFLTSLMPNIPTMARRSNAGRRRPARPRRFRFARPAIFWKRKSSARCITLRPLEGQASQQLTWSAAACPAPIVDVSRCRLRASAARG